MSHRPEDGYKNRPMHRAEALDLILDAGCLVAEQYGSRHLVPGTARLELRPRGEGYDVLMPVEHLHRLYNRGRADGAKEAGCGK